LLLWLGGVGGVGMPGILMAGVVAPGESFSPGFRQEGSRILRVQKLKLPQEPTHSCCVAPRAGIRSRCFFSAPGDKAQAGSSREGG